MRVLFLTVYPELGASSRTRVYQYIPYLEKMGIECKVSPRISTAYFRHELGFESYGLFWERVYRFVYKIIYEFGQLWRIFAALKHDIVFVQKELLFLGPVNLGKLLRRVNRNIVYDFDDAIFTSEPSSKLSEKENNKRAKKLSEMLKIGKWVIVENNYCKAFASKYCEGVSIITGPIDTERYYPKKKPERDEVVIGWIGGPSTVQYLKLIENVFKRLALKYENLVFEVIGVENFKIEGLNIIAKKWGLDTEVRDLQNFDIGIMPLPNNRSTRGKGGYKLLQYMAVEMPIIASPVGINCEIIKEGLNGYLVTSEKKWIEKLSILIENRNLRKQMGMEGRKIAEDRYSLRTGIPKMLRIFKQVAST